MSESPTPPEVPCPHCGEPVMRPDAMSSEDFYRWQIVQTCQHLQAAEAGKSFQALANLSKRMESSRIKLDELLAAKKQDSDGDLSSMSHEEIIALHHETAAELADPYLEPYVEAYLERHCLRLVPRLEVVDG